MGIAMVKALIQGYDDIEEWQPLLSALQDLKKNDQNKFVDEVCKNDFIEWMYLKIEQIIETQDAALFRNVNTMFSFLIDFTDKSAYFCQKITENESLLNFIKFIIQNDNQVEEFFSFAIFIINNIEFQLENLYFNDEDVKNFLIKQIPFNEKLLCLVTLMRLSSSDEIKQFEEEIFIIIPELIKNCELCRQSSDMKHSGVGIEEILKNILVICKSEKVKDKLKENDDLINSLKIIESDIKFSDYKSISRNILSLLGKVDNANELE